MTLNSIIYTSILIVAAAGFILTLISFFASRMKGQRNFALEINTVSSEPEYSQPGSDPLSIADYTSNGFQLRSESVNIPVNDNGRYRMQTKSAEPRGLAANYYYSVQRRNPLPRMKVVNDYYWYLPQKSSKFKFTP